MPLKSIVKTRRRRWGLRLAALWAAALALGGCVSADPQVVAQAVDATLRAAPTATPIVVVVTALSAPTPSIPTLTAPSPATATLPEPPTATATQATSPTSPSPATATPSPTGAPTETATPSAAGKLLFEDNFQQPGNWDLGQEDTLQRKVIANGWLSVTVKLTDRFVLLYRPQSAPTVHIRVTALAPACHARDRYGLIFRVKDSQNYYQFDVDCDGRFRLAKTVDGALTPLVDWTANAAIRAGGGSANDLSVRAIGPNLTVSANGILLARTTDETFALGGFGFKVGSGLTVPYTAAFQNLRVSEPAP